MNEGMNKVKYGVQSLSTTDDRKAGKRTECGVHGSCLVNAPHGHSGRMEGPRGP